MILACFMVMQYLNYFSAIHSLIILGVIIQFVYILLPKVRIRADRYNLTLCCISHQTFRSRRS